MKCFNLGLLLAIAVCAGGCGRQQESESVEAISFDDAVAIGQGDTIYSSLTQRLADVDVAGNHILLALANDDNAFVVIDRDSNNVELAIKRGQGPEDVVSGKIMKSSVKGDARSFVITDGNNGKVLNIAAASTPEVTVLSNPGIVQMGQVTVSDSLVAGHQMMSPYQFTIRDNHGNEKNLDYYLSMSDELKNQIGPRYEMLMSNNFALNPAKDRLLSFSFFFDCALAYTLDGELIGATRDDKDVTADAQSMMDGNFWLYTLPYATPDACYLKAIKNVDNEPAESYVCKYDWDGELTKIYRLPDNNAGGYAVDGSTLYTIVADSTGDDETYSVVAYTLD